MRDFNVNTGMEYRNCQHLLRKGNIEIRQTSSYIIHMKKSAFKPIDQEEKDLMDSLENDEWNTVENFETVKEAAVLAARNTLKKDKRINLRLTQKDYHDIQVKAVEEGIPYQTLISSIVHKYLNGSLAQKN